LVAAAGVLLATSLTIAPVNRAAAQAQQSATAGQQGSLEEITVTGSRILRRDYSANAPITTIDQQAFQATSTIGVETVLNQLPQFVPAITQFSTTDVQQTANNTIGGSFVSLRGLGPNRNLVLIDGKRAQPANPQMFVDTNMIPAAAIQRVELITGGASAVYGADAVGGVVNFILKNNYEGASVETRIGDTEAGGNQEVLVSGLLGVNAAEKRGNVMIGLEHATRTKVLAQQRDWRVADMANPAAPATAFGWGTDPWVSSTIPGVGALDALNVGNFPSQAAVNSLFSQAQACSGGVTAGFFGYGAGTCAQNAQGVNLGVPNNVRFLVDRATGTVYTGLMENAGAAGAYRYPNLDANGVQTSDPFGKFQGLPFRVRQPNGAIKENVFYNWASYPLDRDSAFAKGHFDVNDNIKVTGTAMFTRTNSETSLGLTADNITFWGVPIPFSNNVYTGNAAKGIPSSLNPDGTTNAAYLPGGRFGLNCPPTGGCTERQAWPVPPEIAALFSTRASPEAPLWLSAPPDYIRNLVGARAGQVTNTTSQLSLGVEGNTQNGKHHWDVTVSSGYTDNLTIQSGSTRLSQYRAIMASPNFGHGFIGDPNPYIVGFAESIATCTSGFPALTLFTPTKDCITAVSPDLKNKENLKQTVFEGNLTGDLAQMKAGTLSYALGVDHRENSYAYEPDNLSQNQNFIDPIAGLFPNENSSGKYDVSEVYGELLVPIIAKGPKGVDHFNLELGARTSDWSIPGVKTLTSYKALVDWGFTPRYRLRGGVNRAHRAPNLGELFSARTQIFGGPPSAYGDQCSQRNATGPFSANPLAPGNNAAQAAQTLAICTALMGTLGAATYYGVPNPTVGTVVNTNQATAGGIGITNQLGNQNLSEEDSDTMTIGVVMDISDSVTLAVDYYNIEIKHMIAIEGPDSVYERCLSTSFNPTGSISSPACLEIFRDPTNGNAANVDLLFSNAGRALVEGVDLQLNWTKMMKMGRFNLNSVANFNFKSETQDRPNLATRDWAGTTGCALQIQCQGYDYRIFTTLTYFRGPWSMSLRHQYWPSILPAACGTNSQASVAAACDAALATGGGVRESYQLFALSGSYTFNDKYTVRVGIENLLDKDPPLVGYNPQALPYATAATHAGLGLGTAVGSTYDPLGRRTFVSFSMNF
jgi:outer membrane receptor protein involved in Fe transport